MKKLSLLAAALCALVSFNLRAEVVEIATPEDFAAQIPANPAGEFKLSDNIDLTGSGYVTIPEFSGTLDGNGKTLSGVGAQPLFTSLSGSVKNIRFDGSGAVLSAGKMGLFCVEARGARFEDVVVGNATIKVNASNKYEGIGLFAGYAYDGTTFVRCSTLSDATVTGNYCANNNVGGFVGKVMNDTLLVGVVASFSVCTNNAVTVAYSADNSGGQGHGGFVGKCQLKASAKTDCPNVIFDRCVNLSDIEVKVGNLPTGGFVGRYETSAKGEFLVFTNCLNFGSIYLTAASGAPNGGGFVGIANKDTITYLTGCVNRGAINVGNGNAGGLVGYCYGYSGEYTSAFVQDCANYGAITGTGSGGLFGTVLGNVNRSCGVVIKNCANYGAASGEMMGVCKDIKNKTTIDNVFGLTANMWQSLSDSCTVPSVQNAISAEDDGYDAQAACEALAARAELYGWDKWWKVGKVSGKPELLQWSGDVIVICTVRYLDWDGIVLKESQVEKGTADIPPEDPAREGYVFIGWDKSTDCVQEDMEVTAQYRERVAGEIGSPADFVTAMTTDPSGSYFLANDIDLADSGYTTVAEFSGSLDGAGHALSGIGAQQLFTTVSGSIVNLTLDGATLAGPTAVNGTEIGVLCNIADGAAFTNVIVRGYKLRHNQDVSQKYIGLFAAKAYGGTEFVRCETGSDASVGQPSGKRNCGQGGFVGSVVTSTESGVVAMFVDCTNRAEIVYEAGNGTDGWGSGGFVGKVSVGSDDGVSEVRFVRCVNFGKVNAQQCGGIVGYVLTASKPGKLYFNGCINYGTFGAGTKNAGGIVGTQAQTENTGIGMSFTNCVNYGVITVASENAGGIVGRLLGARNNATMGRMEIVSCANYADINVNGNVGGIVGKAKDNGTWGGSLTTIINNCANYGALTGAVAGDLIGLLGPNASGNSSTSAVLDNCFGLTALPVGYYEEPLKEFTMTNMKSAADDGYEPTPAKKALNAVAGASGYGEWIVGKVGGKKYPELAIFCANPQSPNGLMLLLR